ncbi:MAG TPA: TIM-barrel domain-containing protein [Solirubrobacterales bacterium]|nr:TIM-barrel domain-containing protein [Solirubrobacterales bacterium]
MRARSEARLLVLIGVLAGCGVVTGSASAGIAVDAESGRIAVRGLAAAGSLREASGGGGPGGRVGFLAGGGWHHATALVRVRRVDRGRRVVLASDDPAGRRIVVAIEPRRRGVRDLRVRVAGAGDDPVEAVGIGFRATGSERMLGFGERSDHVDQRGNVVESYVGEGPYQQSEYPIIAATVPPWGVRNRSDATYFPMPWLLSTRGYGALVRNLETSRYRLGTESHGEWSVEVDARRLRLALFAGPRPRDALRRLSAAVGRQPRPAAPWLFGPWVQTGHSNTEPDELGDLATLRDADAPYSAVETHMRYMPCGSDLGQEEAERERTAGLHATGAAALTYTREALCASYTEPFDRAVARDAFLEHRDGSPYTFPTFVGSGVTQVGMLDFTDPDAVPIYRSILDRAYRAGYDGWMEDYGEYAPPDSVADNGMTGKRMHNFYPVTYHRAGLDYARSKRRPLIRFTRSGFTGAARHSQIVWGGDPTTGWGFDGLRSAVREGLTMGLSGVSLWGSDIGGFFSFSGQTLDPELLARWLEFGAFSGVMRTKAQGIPLPKSARPQVWEQPTLPIYRRYAKLRTQLYPYLVAADRSYARTGMPIMRQLALSYPRDRRAGGRDGEYLFGPDLLVAPVLAPGVITRRVYLPRGRWVNFWDAVEFRTRAGAFRISAPARARAGRRAIDADAPLEEIPIFARAGALLPLLPARVETLAPYGTRDHVGLDDARGRLHVLAFPRGTTAARFGRRGRLRSSERGRGWRLEVDSPRPIRIDLEASMATLANPFRPRIVKLDGRRLGNGWSYDRADRVLRIRRRVAAGATITATP